MSQPFPPPLSRYRAAQGADNWVVAQTNRRAQTSSAQTAMLGKQAHPVSNSFLKTSKPYPLCLTTTPIFSLPMKGFSGPKVCEQKAEADAEAGDFYSPAELYADIPDLSHKSYTLQTLLMNLNKMLFWY